MARSGRVVCANFGRVTSLALDPIEKKPLAGFMPGSKVLSVGSYGCNFDCPFCQNASIARAGEDEVAWQEMTPERLVQIACELRAEGNVGIAYTYNEPLVGHEWVVACADLAREAGLVNVAVTNGGVSSKVFAGLLGLIDAMNVDVKGPDQAFYDLVGGDWETVRANVEAAARSSCHLEVTTLVIPGLNDDEEGIAQIAAWLASLDPSVHYHISRFFPCHRMTDRPPTSVACVERLAKVASRYLENVHLGNV